MKVLILGYGRLGKEIVKQTNWDYISIEKDNIDITIPESYIKYLSDYDTILNCIANTNTQDNDKTIHWDVNYLGVIDLVDICKKLNKKLIHISTDYLYAKSNSLAKETDVPVHENNWYCYTKMLADGYIQAKLENYLLIRTSFKVKPYPWNKAWIDLLTNADYIDVIAYLIIQLIKLQQTGIFNVGTNMKTFYDLAKQTSEKVEPVLDDYSFNRPHDVTMDLSKLEKVLSHSKPENK